MSGATAIGISLCSRIALMTRFVPVSCARPNRLYRNTMTRPAAGSPKSIIECARRNSVTAEIAIPKRPVRNPTAAPVIVARMTQRTRFKIAFPIVPNWRNSFIFRPPSLSLQADSWHIALIRICFSYCITPAPQRQAVRSVSNTADLMLQTMLCSEACASQPEI